MKFGHLLLGSLAIACLAGCGGEEADSSIARRDYVESTRVEHKRADGSINIRDVKDQKDLVSKTLAMKGALLGGDPVEMANLVRSYKDLLEKDASYGDEASNAAYKDLKSACDKDELCSAELVEPGAAKKIKEERKKAEEEEKKKREGEKSGKRPGSGTASIKNDRTFAANGSEPDSDADSASRSGSPDPDLAKKLEIVLRYDLTAPRDLVAKLSAIEGRGRLAGRSEQGGVYAGRAGSALFLGLTSDKGGLDLRRTIFDSGHMSGMDEFDAVLGARAAYRGEAFSIGSTGSEPRAFKGLLTYVIDVADRSGRGAVTDFEVPGRDGTSRQTLNIALERASFSPIPTGEAEGLADGSTPGLVVAAKGEAVSSGDDGSPQADAKHTYMIAISKDGSGVAGVVKDVLPNPILMYGDKQPERQ